MAKKPDSFLTKLLTRFGLKKKPEPKKRTRKAKVQPTATILQEVPQTELPFGPT